MMDVSTTTIDQELQADLRTGEDPYQALLGRLNHQSVVKHFNAYEDVDWDAPGMGIDPTDPRWELSTDDPLGATDWYRSRPQDLRARIGLHGVVSAMKTGLQFESVLKRGLLDFAFMLPNGAPEFRYAYHEVAEETQHALMFQEFVNRSGIDSRGMPWYLRFGSRRVITLGRRFPALFFMFVLGGEDPIDYVQRRALKRGDNHPLLERIMRIHVTEEARHLSFARHWLKREVPRLGWARRQLLAVATPILLGQMSNQMLRPGGKRLRRLGMPRRELRGAYRSPEARQFAKDAVRKVRNLCAELGLINPVSRALWRLNGLWDAAA